MKHVRLPPHIKPERYRILMKPDLKGFTFDGEETIYLKITKSTSEIVLHAKELSISQARLKINGRDFKPVKISLNAKAQTATFKFNQKLPKGTGELDLKFKGVLNDKMRGFYRGRYEHLGRQKHLAVTQFEATDARRAFPCFDEPAHKAIFDVSLRVPKKLTAVSNTVETEILEHQGGYKTVKFAPSPKMSTYLLAFIVGELEFIEGRTKHNVLVRIFTTPGKKHQAKFALDTAIRCLEFYNDYFNIPYPLPVLDLIAVPDFSSAAMENWGAITYRETALLVDAENSSLSNKQWVAIVIAHEIAHQWFGNLVTMEWWTHLWLNEGFASYMEYLCTDKLFPQWKMWEQYVAQRFNHALELDGLSNTHPIEVTVHHPEEISEIFDAVSYAKGSVVIRMLAEYLGPKNFRDGLRHYLTKHAYNNASTEHLWEAFEKVSGKPVKALMKNWTTAPGYPLVKITEGRKSLKLSQSRYFSSALSKDGFKNKTLWHIPINFRAANGPEAKFLLKQGQTAVKKTTDSWVKFNSGETGFFRTDYPAQMLSKLALAVSRKKLPPVDRLGIIRDAFALAEAGHSPTTQALDLAKNYSLETDCNVWLMLAVGLSSVANMCYGQAGYEDFKKFAVKLYQNILKKVGWRAKLNESSAEVLLRSLVLLQAGKFGEQTVIKRARKLFWSKTKPKADIRSVVYNLAAAYGGAKEHQRLIKFYQAEVMHEEKDRIARALAQFSSPRLLGETLNFAMGPNVRPQDSPFILAAVFRNPAGSGLALKFVMRHWPALLSRYSSGLSMISRIVGVMDNFYSEEKAEEIEKFFKANKAPGAKRTLRQTLEKIRGNAAWQKRDLAKIQVWLKRHEF